MSKELRTLATKSRDSWVNGKWHTRPTLDIGVDEADSDYIATASPGIVLGLLDRIEQPAQPDCRTCTQHVVSCWSNIKCVNGDQHIEAPKVVLWRSE